MLNLNMTAGCLLMKKNKWKLKEQAEFLRKTGELLERGYPLAEAVHSVSIHVDRRKGRELIEFLHQLKEGYPLNKILSGLNFHPMFVSFVYFAEQHGSLSEAFLEASEMMLKREEDMKKLRKISFYPAILIFMTFFLFFFVEKILIPQYLSMYESMNLSSNVFIHFVSLIGNFLPYFFTFLLFIAVLLLYFYFLRFRKLSPIRKKRILAALPFAGAFFRLFHTYYFAAQLGYLLRGGLSVFESLIVFERRQKNSFDRSIGTEMKRRLADGEKLEEIIFSYPFFEKDFPLVIRHGQANGKLDEELFLFARQCLERLEDKTEKTLKIIQPLLYSFVGLFVVSMYLAILLPMFQLLEGI